MFILFGGILFGLLVIDLVTKWLTYDGSVIVLISNFLSIHPMKNQGVAFGWFYGSGLILTILTGVLIAGVSAFYIWQAKDNKGKKGTTWMHIAFAFFLAGAIGNWFCRLFYNNSVRDFISFDFFPFIFNFADVWLTVGAIMLGIYFLFMYEEKKKPVAEVAHEENPS